MIGTMIIARDTFSLRRNDKEKIRRRREKGGKQKSAKLPGNSTFHFTYRLAGLRRDDILLVV